MRRKPSQNNNYGHAKRRNPQGGRGQPKRNYSAAREKYLSQARDAMSSGDRVMAEYYYQHAEHCFRMLAEEGARAARQPQQPRPNISDHNGGDDMYENDSQDAEGVDVGEQLPAFITSGATKNEDTAAVAAAGDSKE